MTVLGPWSRFTIFGEARGVIWAFIRLENELAHVQFDLSNGVSMALGRSARLPLFAVDATLFNEDGLPSMDTELVRRVVVGFGFGGGAGTAVKPGGTEFPGMSGGK